MNFVSKRKNFLNCVLFEAKNYFCHGKSFLFMFEKEGRSKGKWIKLCFIIFHNESWRSERENDKNQLSKVKLDPTVGVFFLSFFKSLFFLPLEVNLFMQLQHSCLIITLLWAIWHQLYSHNLIFLPSHILVSNLWRFSRMKTIFACIFHFEMSNPFKLCNYFQLKRLCKSQTSVSLIF